MQQINEFQMDRYVRFIDSCREQDLEEGHIHHIIPVSMGGSDDPGNLILLTERQHFVAHKILFKAYGEGPMATAFFMMSNFQGRKSSRLYQSAIRSHAARLSSLFTGVKRNEEVRKRISEGSLGKKLSSEHIAKISERNKGNQYNLGKKKSAEDKEKCGSGRRGKLNTEDHRAKISAGLMGNSWNKGKPFSEERKAGLRGIVRSPLQLKICPHCGTEGKGGAMHQHHFDKCKQKP